MNQFAVRNSFSAMPHYYAGPYYRCDECFECRLHAPRAQSVALTFSNDGLNWFTHEMVNLGNGSFVHEELNIKPDARYWYVLDGLDGFPDPWPRYQPDGPHEASQIVCDAEFVWHDHNWQGRHWSEAVIYELHVGTFTPGGTFIAAIERLKSLQELGITVVQVMPIWTVPGNPNWGYDANYIFSVNADYGRPDDFKSFIDAAHLLGIQVFLDVIYSHLGIEGNYLSKFDEEWLLPDDGNQWGAQLNLDRSDCGVARDMVVLNVLFWLQEFHLDGLRIDAPIAIEDKSETHILIEMAEAVRDYFKDGRQIHLILEKDHYAGRLVNGRGISLYNASNNIKGCECLIDFVDCDICPKEVSKITNLMECLKGGIGFDFTEDFPNRVSAIRTLHSDRQIIGVQNHDLIGNRQDPHRVWTKLDISTRELVLAIMCLSPASPSFFMGDEIGCEQVFPFFCKFGDVSEAEVLAGRIQDFEFTEHSPDYWLPFSRHTFEAAIILWPAEPVLKNNTNYRLISRLLEMRRKSITPLSKNNKIVSSSYRNEGKSHQIAWNYSSGNRLVFDYCLQSSAGPNSSENILFFLEGESWQATWRID